MVLENKIKNENIIEVPEDTESMFKRIMVEIYRCDFDFSNAISNYYELENGDGLYCELVETQYLDKKEQIGQGVFININEDGCGLHGEFERFVCERYNLHKEKVVTLNIKKIIRNSS